MEQPALKFYPVGIQTFSDMREENYLYIDKTEHVYRMTHSAGKYMFARFTPISKDGKICSKVWR